MNKKYVRPMSIDKIREIHAIINEYGLSSTLEAIATHYDNLTRRNAENVLMKNFVKNWTDIAKNIRIVTKVLIKDNF